LQRFNNKCSTESKTARDDEIGAMCKIGAEGDERKGSREREGGRDYQQDRLREPLAFQSEVVKVLHSSNRSRWKMKQRERVEI